jgi:hypothetical protein
MATAFSSCGGRAQALHQKVDLHPDAIWPASVICKIEIPLAQRVVVHPIL